MRLDLINLRSVGAVTPGASNSLLAEWRVGAILEAVAVRDSASGQLFLDIGGQRHPARLPSKDDAGPQNGERLTVRILRTSPVLALEHVPPTESDPATETALDALRRFVPKQSSPAPLAANLAWLTRNADGANALPRAVTEMAAKLWAGLPDADAVTDPTTLERALSRSGTFLEAALAKDDGTSAAKTAVASDLKTMMLQLARVLREHGARPSASFADVAPHAQLPTATGPLSSLGAAPATLALLDTPQQQMNELARQIDGSIARMTMTQITNSAQNGPVQAMLIELPVRLEDRPTVMRFRLERDSSRNQYKGSDGWAIEAALDLGNAGALHARVTLNGYHVGVQLRAESPAVVDMLNQRSAELESMLREAGLEVDRIVCRHGMPAGDTGQRFTRLLDVHA